MAGLFSGIGGFEYAAIMAGIVPVFSNEIDQFCCEILRKNFIHEINQKDIRDVEGSEIPPIDIICGGDPCQPHSLAGLGKGEKDSRYLWPEMLRIIRAKRPAWVVNENVDGTISNGILDRKCDDLEREGYEVQAFIIPAEAVGALHKRERVWIVAYNANGYHSGRETRKLCSQKKKEPLQKWNKVQLTLQSIDLRVSSSHTNSERCEKFYAPGKSALLPEGIHGNFGFGPYPHGNFTKDEIKSWINRIVNGLPKGMDYTERNKRIKALGNAIVPQIAYEIMKIILDIENQHYENQNQN